jgi:hypothetical protein
MKQVWHRFCCIDFRIGVYAGGRHCTNGDLADLAADRAIGRNRSHPDVYQLFPRKGYLKVR